MSATKLELLKCHQCAGPVPLGDGRHTRCPWCGAEVEIPPRYGELLAHRNQAAELRRQAEPLWQRLGQRPPRWVLGLSTALLVLLPPLVTLLGNLLSGDSRPVAALTALFTLPAVLPGAGLWIWVAAVGATVDRFRGALVADPPPKGKGPPLCRSCGAPLQLDADAVAATCDYCGTDSLVKDLPVKRIERRLRDSRRSLTEAVHGPRLRRLSLGTVGILLGLAGSSVLLLIAVQG